MNTGTVINLRSYWVCSWGLCLWCTIRLWDWKKDKPTNVRPEWTILVEQVFLQEPWWNQVFPTFWVDAPIVPTGNKNSKKWNHQDHQLYNRLDNILFRENTAGVYESRITKSRWLKESQSLKNQISLKFGGWTKRWQYNWQSKWPTECLTDGMISMTDCLLGFWGWLACFFADWSTVRLNLVTRSLGQLLWPADSDYCPADWLFSHASWSVVCCSRQHFVRSTLAVLVFFLTQFE